MRKILTIVLLLSICLVLGGCFRADVKVGINEDGSCNLSYKFLAIPAAAEQMEEFAKNLEELQFKLEKIKENNMIGFKANKYFSTVSELNSMKMFRGTNSEEAGFSLEKGWFYDLYKINITNTSFDDKNNEISTAILSQTQLNITFEFPSKVENSNAHQIYNDGKTLVWNFTLAQDNHLEANAKVWHYVNIAITIIIPLLIVIILSLQRRNKEIATRQLSNNPIIAGSVAALLIIGTGTGYYAINKPQVKPVQQSVQMDIPNQNNKSITSKDKPFVSGPLNNTPNEANANYPESQTKTSSNSALTKSYTNERYGFSIEYPSDFVQEKPPANGDGLTFKSADGKFTIAIAGSNYTDVLDSYEKAAKRASYRTKGDNWFVISGLENGEIYYQKTFWGKGSSNSMYLTYPQSQKEQYADLVAQLEKSFKPGNLNSGH